MFTDQKSYDGKTYLMNPNSEEFIQNPYQFYQKRFEDAGGVTQLFENSWNITSYEAMDKVLSHPNAGKSGYGTLLQDRTEMFAANPVMQVLSNWMLMKNPPDHTRLRKLVLKAFTPRMVAQLEPMMRETMSELIDGIKKGPEEFDLVKSVSYPLPVTVISEMMGIPKSDRDLFHGWSTDFAIALASDVTALPEQLRARLNKSANELIAYFEKLIEEKKGRDLDDLVSVLMRAEEENDTLSTAEILSQCTLLLVAGHETTTSLISNGMNMLLDHPDQYQMLRDDASLIPAAVEEFLRYDPPVQSLGRYILDDIEIDTERGSYTFPKGHFASSVIGFAGRDPLANERPNEFDITRKESNHLSFAKGIHYCLGAGLARLEAKVAFEVMLEDLPQLERAGQAVRAQNALLRGFRSLPLKRTL